MVETTTRIHDESMEGHSPSNGLALVQRVAGPKLRSVVRDYWGYAEQTGRPQRRRELPSADVIFIVNLGEPLLVEQSLSGTSKIPPGGGFVAGLHDT